MTSKSKRTDEFIIERGEVDLVLSLFACAFGDLKRIVFSSSTDLHGLLPMATVLVPVRCYFRIIRDTYRHITKKDERVERNT